MSTNDDAYVRAGHDYVGVGVSAQEFNTDRLNALRDEFEASEARDAKRVSADVWRLIAVVLVAVIIVSVVVFVAFLPQDMTDPMLQWVNSYLP